MIEKMDIVDDFDNVVGVASQEEIYARRLNHRIVHVFVIHPNSNQIYLQKRSKQKSYLPGFYCTSAGGHVRAGEDYYAAACRELHEEVGLSTPLREIVRLEFVSDNHKRNIALFVTHANEGFRFNDGEVSEGNFFSLEGAYRLVMNSDMIHPQLKICFQWLYANKETVLVN